MDWPYCGVLACASFTQCFTFDPSKVSASFIGRGGTGVAGITTRCQRRHAGAHTRGQGYGRGKEEKGEWSNCKLADC